MTDETTDGDRTVHVLFPEAQPRITISLPEGAIRHVAMLRPTGLYGDTDSDIVAALVLEALRNSVSRGVLGRMIIDRRDEIQLVGDSDDV